jgi:hypothetical protein
VRQRFSGAIRRDSTGGPPCCGSVGILACSGRPYSPPLRPGRSLRGRVRALLLCRSAAALASRCARRSSTSASIRSRISRISSSNSPKWTGVSCHVHGRLEPELLPLGRVGPAVLDFVLADGALDVVAGGRAFGTEPAARDGAVGVALYLGDPAVLDVDPLAAAYRAGGAFGPDDLVGLSGAWLEICRAGELRRLAQGEPVFAPNWRTTDQAGIRSRIPKVGFPFFESTDLCRVPTARSHACVRGNRESRRGACWRAGA